MQEQLLKIKQLIDITVQKGIFANAESVLDISNAFNEIVNFINEHGTTNTDH